MVRVMIEKAILADCLNKHYCRDRVVLRGFMSSRVFFCAIEPEPNDEDSAIKFWRDEEPEAQGAGKL
jgi:hypothetical protein